MVRLELGMLQVRYLLIDANHLTARCHYANHELARTDGLLSGAVFGFLRGIDHCRAETRIANQNMICCWDAGRSEVRKTIYPEYKAGRKMNAKGVDQEEDRLQYRIQLEALNKAIGHSSLRQIKVKGMEADDIIGIVAKDFEEAGHSVVIYSGDHDLHQLVSDKVSIFAPRKGILTKEDILEKWALPSVKGIPYMKAIIGDKSDNIEGIKGIGPVKGGMVVQHHLQYGTFEAVNGCVPKLKKLLDEVVSNDDLVKRNLKLVTIPQTLREANIYYTQQQLSELVSQLVLLPTPDTEKFAAFLLEWELESLLERVGAW